MSSSRKVKSNNFLRILVNYERHFFGWRFYFFVVGLALLIIVLRDVASQI
jgi:hypothetical protein